MLRQVLAHLVTFLLATTTFAGDLYQLRSDAGLYNLHLAPNVSVVQIGELHSWTLRIADADGRKIDDAKVLVDGGMPTHGHGLPTAPKVTATDEVGRYLIEGVRFNMPGDWEIHLEITGKAGSDTVKAALRL